MAGRTDVLNEPQRTLDQPAPTVLIPTLDEHEIEHERGLQQPLHAPRHPLLGNLDPAAVSARARVHHGKLRSGEFRCPDLDLTKRAQLSGPH